MTETSSRRAKRKTAPLVPEIGEPDNVWRRMTAHSWTVTVFAIISAFVIGAVLICITDQNVQTTAGYFFAQPSAFFGAVGHAVGNAYTQFFYGAFYNPAAPNLGSQFQPLTESLTQAVPLILAGLGLAIGFNAGLFNIGGQGQIILGATAAGFIGFYFHFNVVLQLFVGLALGIVGGAIWAGIAGLLKARTGANEVVVTIMLNWIAFYGLAFLLTLATFHRQGINQPKTPPMNARLPLLFGPASGTDWQWRLNWGLPIAILAAVVVWFLMNKSTIGFRFRAVGFNQQAAKTAGISVPWTFVGTMVAAGALCGLAGAVQVMGVGSEGLTGDIAGTIGFDAITVALLGRSKPVGVVLSGLLFGVLAAGSRGMQGAGQPIEMVMILQSVIVLFIAAPPLVRTIFRLGTPKAAREESLA